MALRQIKFFLFCTLSLSPRAWAAGGKSESPYEQANKLERSGDYAGARTAFLALSRKQPANPLAQRALFRAARLLEDELGDEPGALREYQRLVRDAPESVAAVHALVHTEEILQRTQPSRLLPFLAQELAAQPHTGLTPTLQRHLARAMGGQGAAALLDQVAKNDAEGPLKGDDYYAAAEAHRAIGDDAGAALALEAALETKEHSILPFNTNSAKLAPSLFLLGAIYRDDLKDQQKAKAAFQKIVGDYPDSRLVDDALAALRGLARAGGNEKEAQGLQAKLAKLRPDSRFVVRR